MKKLIILFCFPIVFISCKTPKEISNSLPLESNNSKSYAKTIKAKDLKTMLYVYASDDFEGRKTGEPGQKKAVEFIKNYYIKNKIPSPIAKNDYYQDIPEAYFDGKAKASENVIAFIEGDEKPDEVLIISAHLDHLGIDTKGNVNNGADDDGSGTVAILKIAEAFKNAKKNGINPKRSIVFLHVTGEELGLYGSRYYTDKDPIFPLKKTIANLNIDMIGRVDNKHDKTNSNYIYLIGSDKLSKELHHISEKVNNTYCNLELDYTYNDSKDPNRFYYRSDHYNFAKNNIPVIFYFNGTHEDYHKSSDTPDKINYELLEARTKLIFYTAWELANREEPVTLD